MPPQEARKIKFAEQKSPPLVTYMIICLIMVIYAMGAGAKSEYWFQQNAFQAAKFFELIKTAKYSDVVTMLTYSNLMTFNLWYMIGAGYFTWVFGTSVESRVGANRFIIFLFLGLTLPWLVQAFDSMANHPWFFFPFEQPDKPYVYYFGPNLLIFTLLGAYAVLTPAKKVDLSGGMPRPKNEIFKKQKEIPVTERFGFNTWVYVAAFCVYQAGVHGTTIAFHKGFDSCGLLAVLTAAGLGYYVAQSMLNSAVETFKDGPLKLEALKRYRELVDLDVSQEDAIKGTARAMGLPNEQIRSWVTKNKGRLSIS